MKTEQLREMILGSASQALAPHHDANGIKYNTDT